MHFSLLPLALATVANALPLPNFLMKPPREDSFYDAPSNLADLKNGEVYSTRQVQPDFELQLSLSEVHQIAYKTKDAYGNDTHSVATVFKPLVPAQDHKLLSYQFWEDSDQLNCSPSYTLVKGVLSPDAFTGTTDTWAVIQFALLQGIYVVASDHEGPRSAFIEGYTQGQTGLDGIQAAINFYTLGQDTPVALYGYSGGASATVWMSNLHESYAPHINIAGAVHGGTPLDLRAQVNWLDREDRMFSGFILGAFTGLLNAYPDKNETIWPHLDSDFQKDIITMKEPNNCIIPEILNYQHEVFHTKMDVNFWTFGPLVELLNLESLFKNSSGIVSTPKFPRYMFHAQSDEIIPVSAVTQYIHEQCDSGANIQFVEWPGNDHLSVEYLGLPDALQFINQIFDGTVPHVQCGYRSNDILTLASITAGDALGQVVADILSFVNDITTPFGTKIKLDKNAEPVNPSS